MSEIPVETDVVVAGAGATGLTAAVTLAEGGAKVVVFEKQRSLGGTTNFIHGTFAVESDMQRERFIDLTRDQAFKSIMDYVQALFSFFIAPLLGTVILGMLWKRATRAGGFWGLLAGTVSSIAMWAWVKVDPGALRHWVALLI